MVNRPFQHHIDYNREFVLSPPSYSFPTNLGTHKQSLFIIKDECLVKGKLYQPITMPSPDYDKPSPKSTCLLY